MKRQLTVTYIFHNCFVLKTGRETFIFDMPSEGFITSSMKEVIRKSVSGYLYSVTSHAHGDHFNSDLSIVSSFAKNCTHLLSSDAFRAVRGLDRDRYEVISLDPDQKYSVNDLHIQTFMSNDQGIAIFIKCKDIGIYYGGDLARWDWEEGLSSDEEKLYLDYYDEKVLEIASLKPDIAFSNADARVRDYSGALQFINTVKPSFFIPMHAFGNTGMIHRFAQSAKQTDSELFLYSDTGDSMKILIP